MRNTRQWHFLIGIIGLSVAAWGQGGGRRGTATQTPPQAGNAPAQQAGGAGRGGRGAGAGAGAPAGAGASANSEFYSYDTSATGEPPFPEGPPAEAHQKITIKGETLAYTSHAGYMPLRNATSGQSEAHIFYTSYSKDGVSEANSRPVLFFFGGAPGVAATWQEFGGFGPKRMKWASDGAAIAPPYTWSDNPNTLLGQADLVFVNPVGTAFSRPDQPARGPNFWNTAADIASLGEFVRNYVTVANRRNSPIFLAGEDFGTGRVSGLAAYLHEHGTPVQGVVLLSMTMSADSQAGDAQYITLLPSLIMSAWQHKKLSPELSGMSAEQISGQARQFASREYLHALYKADRMTAEERTKVVADMARLTGVSKAFLENNDLRVTIDRFNTELLHEQHRTLSFSDARVSGFSPSAGGGGRGGGGGFGGGGLAAIDFNLSERTGGFQIAYESYLKNELTFGAGNGLFYLSNGGVTGFTANGNDDASLSGAFARNPNLHLFVGVNYFDLNAPFYATEFTLAHLNVSPEVRAKNITVKNYEAGQMAYLDNKASVKLQTDLASFLDGATAPQK